MDDMKSIGSRILGRRKELRLTQTDGKAPTREQKKIMKAHGLIPENWLVVKNLPETLEGLFLRMR